MKRTFGEGPYLLTVEHTLEMSETLGEKLRQAREERGISISEVAEQTRISALYLESIENDDYRNLPGGIFNKGFVKSFAKYVGVNEQEALMDYARLMGATQGEPEQDLKVYRPEVLTDGHSRTSGLGTIIAAVLILALMTGGVLFLVNYLRRPAAPPTAADNLNVAANTTTDVAANTDIKLADSAPDMATVKIEFKSTTQPVRLMATSDGTKSDESIAAGETKTFEPKESLTLNYNRWNASVVSLTINGKAITLPSVPADPKAQRIEFTINKDNLAQIWSSGSVNGATAPADTSSNTSTAVPPSAPTRPAAAPKPAVSNTAANTARPPATPKPPASNTAKPPTMTTKPTPKP